MVRALAEFMEFCYIMCRSVIDEQDLTDAQSALDRFEHHRLVFQQLGVRPNGFSLPRMHALRHYFHHVREFAAPNGLCSSITEAKHIKAVKEPWRRSNRHNAIRQILLTNQRLDKLAASHADFEARGMLRGTCLAAATIQTQDTFSDNENNEDAVVISRNTKSRASTNQQHESPGDAFAAVHNQGPAEGPTVMSDVALARNPGTLIYDHPKARLC